MKASLVGVALVALFSTSAFAHGGGHGGHGGHGTGGHGGGTAVSTAAPTPGSIAQSTARPLTRAEVTADLAKPTSPEVANLYSH
jgi:hypothetical protein